MADETEINGKFFDDLSVEHSGDEATPKIYALNRKIYDLEQENDTIIQENEKYKKKIEDLKASTKELSAENVDLKKQLDKAKSENTAAVVVVARAAELESEVSRLQRDLVTAMSDLNGSSVEILNLKRDLESMRNRENEKSVKLEAMVKEKALWMSKVDKLERVESGLRVELMGKEREIQVLKNNMEELEVVVSLKKELEAEIVTMKAEISSLGSSLDEKDKVISSLEERERAMLDDINVLDSVIDGGKNGLINGVSKQWDWMVVGGSTIAAVAALVACCVHVVRRH